MSSLAASTTSWQETVNLLESFNEIQAAALYGSVARGEAESHSDVDLLIVCNGGHKRDLYDHLYPLLSTQFARLSLSLYSPRELSFLSKAKSLFLLHLKRESITLFDETQLLTQILTQFSPKESYKEDFQKSLDLLSPLRSSVSGAPNNLHRLAYVYSLFRVYGVYLLAEHKEFEFSKTKMATALMRILGGQKSNISMLSNLRVLNANFFSGGTINQELLQEINKVPLKVYATALGEVIDNPVAIEEKSYSLAVKDFVAEVTNYSFRLGYRLRTWFLLLVYDGLNIFNTRIGKPELTSFDVHTLMGFTQNEFPSAISDAATESLEYLRNYPLKYFLLDESKIAASRACRILSNIACLVS